MHKKTIESIYHQWILWSFVRLQVLELTLARKQLKRQ